MKQIEEIPLEICDEGDENYVSYSDTDSIYVHAEPLLRFLYPNFDEMGDEEKDKVLEEEAINYQNIINDSYSQLASECFNVPTHKLEMKTEAVIRSAYFRATRRYAQWITKQEGITKEVLDIKGLEFKKANFPPILGKFFKEILVEVLKGMGEEEVNDKITKLRKQILTGEIPFTDLGNPTSVKTLNKYIERKASVGEIFSKMKKGAPAAVKASSNYNDLLRFWKLNSKHNYISQGEKIKWIYLKSNPYQVESIAFLEGDMPDKIKAFIEANVDRNKIFTSILLNKLEGFFGDIGYNLYINEYKNKFFKL
jgi:DNA polymerase elongation subunit (family B)